MSTEREWGLESSDGDQETMDVASEVAAAYEGKLQAENDSRQGERFFWIFALVLCIDVLVFPGLSWGALPVFLLEVVFLIGLAHHLGVDSVVVLLNRIFNRYINK